MSPLKDLLSTLEADDKTKPPTFQCQRTLNMPHQPNIVAFANHESQLAVSLLNGDTYFYATDQLFSSGDAPPLQIIPGGPVRQLIPNPSNEAGLSDLLAIVRNDGRVHLINSQFQPQGGWEPADQDSIVVAASWSPKGKQIALGLVLGDIVAFSPSNKTTIQKHIPPTHSVLNHLLVSIVWLPGAGHNFSTSYHEKNGDDKNTLHAIHLDKEVVIATEIDAPYIAAGRAPQATFPILLPKWDEDASDNSRFIFIIGDIQTADLGIFGYANGQWYHYPSDNISVPLHEETMDDTILLSLDLDLVNPSGNPILYGYLNDGTIHAWNLNNADKPYSGMLTVSATTSSQPIPRPTPAPSGFSSFAQSPPAAFSSPQQASSGFGQSSGFGTSSGFGQAGNNAFGGSSNTTSAFGSGGSAYGNNGSAFSDSASGGGQQPAFGSQPNNASGGFGSAGSLGGGFGAFGTSNNNAFGGNNNTSSAFGSTQSSGGFGSGFGSTPSNNTQEDSMSEDAPSFGGLSLGGGGSTSSPKAGGGLFGSPAPLPLPPGHPSNQSSSASVLKPASGFGAFGDGISADSPLISLTPLRPQVSAFRSSTSAFGQPSFGQLSKPGFGQPTFGQTGFGQRVAPPASTSKPISGGFGAFASNSPVSLNSAAKAPSSGGFGAFAGAPASLTSAATSSQPAKSSGGFASFASGTPSAFGRQPQSRTNRKLQHSTEPASGFAAFGAAGPSPFSASSPPTEPAKPASGGFGAFASQSPTPFGSTAQKAEEQKPAPLSGFTAFGSATPGFGQAAKPSSSGSETPKQTESASSFGGIPPLKDSPFGKGPFGNAPAAPAEPSKSESPTPSSSWASGLPPLANSPFGQGAFARSSDPTKDATPPTSPQLPGSGIAPLTDSPFGKGAFASSSPSSQGSASPSSPSVMSPFNVTPSRPAPPNNAFANLKTTSSFQPSVGFGAFGASASNESSPFFKAAETKTQPVSAFGAISTAPTTTPRPAATSTPTFGAPTSIGVRSAFAPQTPPPTTTPPKTSIGGFSAFSGAKSAFGAASEKTTSFQDLLTGKPGGEDPVKRSMSPPKAKPETPETASQTSQVKAEGSDQGTPTPVFSKPVDVKGKSKEESESLAKGDGSMSSVASSYVDVSHEDGDIRGGEEEDDDDDDADSFLSQSVPSVGDLSDDEPRRDEEEEEESVDEAAPDEGEPEVEEEEEEEEEEEADDERRSPTPSGIPLPSSRSSTTSPSLASSCDTVLPTIIEETTTPPGSPEKKASPVIPSTTPPATLGLGRPSTKPVRSSPLANTVSEQENEDVKPFAPKPRPASPKTPFGVLPLKTEESSTATKARPQTPPLLSSFGGGGGLFGKPAPPPAAPTPPAPKSSLFGLQPFGSPSSPLHLFHHHRQSRSRLLQLPKLRDNQFQVLEWTTLKRACKENALDSACNIGKAAEQRELLAKKTGGSSARADLADPQRWAPSDALKFRDLLSTCTDDLEVSQLSNQVIRTALKELGSGLVKANTRKEEIERFNRAKEDEDFRKMLKARTLGPELVEMKTRLRGELMRKKQEVLRLEDVLKDNKKKMTAMKSQKGVFRSPSLDTVNRTYRNIDTAIRQEQDAIASLTKRLAAVDIARRTLPSSKTSATYRDPRLPDAKSSPLTVPYEAVTTAAALNAERSAQKLKHALLGLRQQPLLNEPKTAASPPLAFLSSSQTSGSPGGVAFNAPLSVPSSLFSDDDFHLNTYTSTSKVRTKERKHSSVPLTKKGDAPSPSPSFDWGPLPQYGPGGFLAK
ncbi:hypothetical protein BDZ89DRAFT_1033594 [Hymenopellis radicata]|nr:hypothetical protein BDZ89DRAFT_1033594 [Hymenopellis radicata]